MSRFKYPRTLHLPWSPGATDDDKVLSSVEHFLGKQFVVTEKLDGENTTIYRDYCHARSLDSASHPSRTWVRNLQGIIGHEIPAGWRICGENMFAKHSIHYQNLPSYFFVFGIYTQDNICLSWDDTKEWTDLLGLSLVPELYRGTWDEDKIKSLWHGKSVFSGTEGEGYVVRLADAFHYDAYAVSAAKYVRADHVQTSEHWLSQPVVKNGMVGNGFTHCEPKAPTS